jgi:hypothetical protein
MLGLRTLMLILLAAVFAVGGPLRALPCHAETVPPCHETAADMPGDMAGMAHDKARPTSPSPTPWPQLLRRLPARLGPRHRARPLLAPGAVVRIAFAPRQPGRFDGLSPAPEHGPPRPLA